MFEASTQQVCKQSLNLPIYIKIIRKRITNQMAQIFKLLNKLKLQPSKVSTGKHSLTTLALLHGLKTIQKVLDVLNVILISLATTESASRRLQSPP